MISGGLAKSLQQLCNLEGIMLADVFFKIKDDQWATKLINAICEENKAKIKRLMENQ